MIETVTPEQVGLSSTRLERVTTWLQEQVEGDRLAGASVLISRRGHIAYCETAGFADEASKKLFEKDTVVRIYSMTKPITSVAAMIMYERGSFQIDDPVSKYLPEFANTPVWNGGDAPLSDTSPQGEPMLVRHLMNHTSGLTYGFMNANLVDAQYRARGLGEASTIKNLEEWVKVVANIPLIYQPGTRWSYSVATDVLGRLVEVWSGKSLQAFFQEEIFTPLGMVDTGFSVAEANQARFASLYGPLVGGTMDNIGRVDEVPPPDQRHGLKLLESHDESRYFSPATVYSGGGGLVSTLSDYAIFCHMLQNGGEAKGARILSPTTINHMRTNHLPDNKDMSAMGQPVWSETSYDGIGFGLGFAVVLDPVKASIITSVGEHHWGGAASTFFWLDPVQDLFVVFLTQLMPSTTYPIRRELRARVYQAILD